MFVIYGHKWDKVRITKENVFTKEEPGELGTQTVDLIDRAIDRGYYEKAKELGRRMYKEFMMLHDFLQRRVACQRRVVDSLVKTGVQAELGLLPKP